MGVVTSGAARPGAGWDAAYSLRAGLCAALLAAACTTQIDIAAELPPAVDVNKGALCPGGATTTLSGTVVAPTPPRFPRPDPLYNALPYAPPPPCRPFP